jgi:two-component system phosphate regulon response regulator PhoB
MMTVKMCVPPPSASSPLGAASLRRQHCFRDVATVLIVESQPEVRELISLTLETGPSNILLAENAEQALTLARAQRPDLVLMDVVLSGEVDGLELCRQLKSDPRTKNAYILFLTAKSQAADRERGYAVGADDYILKPFSPLRLQQLVRDILDGPPPTTNREHKPAVV